jgi:hypothetical protein
VKKWIWIGRRDLVDIVLRERRGRKMEKIEQIDKNIKQKNKDDLAIYLPTKNIDNKRGLWVGK